MAACPTKRDNRPSHRRTFQAALRAAKRVTTETAVGRERLSIPSIAVADFASGVFERFDDKRVLLIGAGKMAAETLRYLRDAGAQNIRIINRSMERAHSLHNGLKLKPAITTISLVSLLMRTLLLAQPVLQIP